MIDTLILTGCVLALAGLWWAWPPLAVIVGGILLLAAGLYARLHNRKRGGR